MTERDPRKDPRCGDVLNVRGKEKRVMAVGASEIGYSTGPSIVYMSRPEWERMVAKAKIVERGE